MPRHAFRFRRSVVRRTIYGYPARACPGGNRFGNQVAISPQNLDPTRTDMTHPLTRRNMLAGLVAGVPLACQAADSAGTSPAPETEGVREVRLEHLRPREIDEAMKECPLLFLPLGTIEWHGLHNIVGLDALKAHMLCVRAAERGGGLVAPPLYGGVGGLDQPHTFVMEAEDDLFSVLLRPGWRSCAARRCDRDFARSSY